MILYRHDSIDHLVVTCTTDLFEHAACAVSYLGIRPGSELDMPRDALAAIIGYIGQEAKGALTIVSTAAVVERSLPQAARGGDSEMTDLLLRDWSGELANQLLGRIKNRLARHQLTFQVGTPISVFAQALRIPPLDGPCSDWHQFSCEYGDLFVRLDMHVNATFALIAPDDDVNAESPSEGELMLF